MLVYILLYYILYILYNLWGAEATGLYGVCMYVSNEALVVLLFNSLFISVLHMLK